MNIYARITIITATTALLFGCAAKPDPLKEQKQKALMYKIAEIKVDPNEENALFYELPGRWRALDADGNNNCITSWHTVSISSDKKTLVLSKFEKTESESLVVSEQTFNILQDSRYALQLQNQQQQDAWQIKQMNLFTFELTRAESLNEMNLFMRCGKDNSILGDAWIMVKK